MWPVPGLGNTGLHSSFLSREGGLHALVPVYFTGFKNHFKTYSLSVGCVGRELSLQIMSKVMKYLS